MGMKADQVTGNITAAYNDNNTDTCAVFVLSSGNVLTG